ncbi:hypothetical protein OCO_06970 [Mycobacterium intracellulare MOTT-02]|nr:hypothetical protein OCO_06970 [Mycobacterium intracellulare MOTT-02]
MVITNRSFDPSAAWTVAKRQQAPWALLAGGRRLRRARPPLMGEAPT